jgi:hypothetical protein
MRRLSSVLALSAALLIGVSTSSAWAQSAPASRELNITFQDGRVTLLARGVTLGDILTEWQRQGGSRIVNAEQLSAGPVTYEFRNVPEAAVLQSLLRNAAGVIMAPRRPGGPTGASYIEQVIVLPTSRPTTASGASPVMTMQSPNPNPVPIMGQPDNDIPPAVPIQNPAERAERRKPDAPSDRPSVGSSGTSATPGVIVAPVKPGTPVPAGVIIK